MTGGIKNFKGKNGTNTFANRKNDINKKGQPRKGISIVNSQLKKEGYSPATKQDIEVNYLSMIQLGQEKLIQMANDKEQPMLIRIIAKSMLGGKGFDIIEKMLDRGIGRSAQNVDVTSKGESVIIQFASPTSQFIEPINENNNTIPPP